MYLKNKTFVIKILEKLLHFTILCLALGFHLHLIICPPNFCGESNSLQQYLHLYIAGMKGIEPIPSG